ncbi:MAG: helix-turn-helix transcriptional regulator [Clostridia bacterium]|nr:helix-turn-helix transcriptional regulator [Clostridia bacterium]
MAYIRVPLKRLVRIKKVITCFARTESPDYHSAIEKHNFWEMVYLRRGRMGYCGGERQGVLTAGQAVFHAPNVPHGLFGDGVHSYEFFIISFESDSSSLAALADRPLTFSPPHRTLVDAIVAERERCFAPLPISPLTPLPDEQIGGQQMIGLYVEQLLIGLLREAVGEGESLFSSRAALERQLVADMQAFLEKGLYDDHLTMEDVCSQFHYGKSRLSAIFRRAMGDSVMHWYHTRKLEEARRLLLESEQSIAEIATSLHFDSPQYFSRSFRRYIGLCPRDYRQAFR